MQPGEKRRLGAEQAILRKFNTFKEANDACIRYANKYNMDVTFMDNSVARYVSAQTNFSVTRLSILASITHVNNYRELDEVYIAPSVRGVGQNWKGNYGSTAKDILIEKADDF